MPPLHFPASLLLLLLASHPAAAGTLCDNDAYGTSLCDGTYANSTLPAWSDWGMSCDPMEFGRPCFASDVPPAWGQISGTIPTELMRLTKLQEL